MKRKLMYVGTLVDLAVMFETDETEECEQIEVTVGTLIYGCNGTDD